ncbi:sodium/proton antiporter [Wolbachia endosymbiont of Drosophila ananassae]|nr:sodium/proton antiporter [Wolbachia endosymbiont of Drosophila ananassae]
MIKDPILNAVTFLMIPFIILFGLYIQFHGDYTPGGGFQAGIIIASGIILYSMLFGVSTTLKAIPYSVIRLTNVLGILFMEERALQQLYLAKIFYLMISC